MDFRRFLQDHVVVEPQRSAHFDGDGNAERGRTDDNIGFERRELLGELLAGMFAEFHAEIDDHHQRDGEIGLDGDDRQIDRLAGDVDRVALTGQDGISHWNFLS